MRARPVVAALSASLGAGVLATAWAQPASLATEVKATYIDKFGDFVDWPAAVLGAPTDPLRLCVVGDDPFGAVLDQATRGQKIGARPVVVVRMDKVEHGAPCHILFVSASSKQGVADALNEVRGDPILTITDEAPASAAGIINFVVLGNRVRFKIDDMSAAQSGLTISSKLLALAVRPEG